MVESILMWLVLIGVPVFIILGVIAFTLRRVVPTNMVHIVQRNKVTEIYGKIEDEGGKDTTVGNVYYEWWSWIPVFGVTVTKLPISNFKVLLNDYDAYDEKRLPFVIDVAAFFRIKDARVAAQRVSSFEELQAHLVNVLQGSVRRILATNDLENIMQERSTFGTQFTQEVQNQIREWGIVTVKNIEFMDIRDAASSKVIANIMAKEKSRIERESRIVIANNEQEAKLKEIDAIQNINIQQQLADQRVGLQTAEKEQQVGIAKEQAKQKIQAEAKVTAERDMEVKKVQEVKKAEIDKDVAVVQAEQEQKVLVTIAEGNKQATVVQAEGNLEAAKRNAEGIRVEGEAKGAAEKALLMAPVESQISLAREIGGNEGYQQYLITIKQVEVSGDVGKELAKAIQGADLKVIANAGDVQEGVSKIGDLFTAKGGTNLTGMLAALAQTEEGKALVGRITGSNSI